MPSLFKALGLGCFKAKSSPTLDTKPVASKRSSSRLSLSDLSSISAASVVSDLSISLGSNLHIFTHNELRDVTHNFSESNFLGEGGFGRVYKGFIDDKLRPGLGAQLVAVKVLDLEGKQGHREWLAEVIFLGQLKHSNLVNLIGYCCEDEHRLLVYEYMERGNLENYLFKSYAPTLPWLTRIKIATGAAKGLAFLHEEEKPVIYRDVKASNILLDPNYNAKLSDFGLATDGPEGDETHISTQVMGTHGYAAPEYIMTGHLTSMSDVFSFGVVLLELLTGRRSVDKSRPSREQNLVDWARPLLKDAQKLERVMDPRLEGQYSAEGARKAAALAYQCLSHHPKSRPKMSSVVKTLETVMKLNGDIPVGFFVYVAADDGKSSTSIIKNNKEGNQEEGDERARNYGHKIGEEKEKEKEKGKVDELHRKRKGRRRRRKIKPVGSRAAHSDTALYKSLGTSLYSPKQKQPRKAANGQSSL